MVDSPIFRYQRNKQQAVDLINKIARINNRRSIDYHQLVSLHTPSHSTLSLYHLFKYKSVRRSVILASLLYFLIQM